MTPSVTPAGLEFAITAQQSAEFARLSGDFNPLHVDAVAARRLQFGAAVCHGVHLVLQAIDRVIGLQRVDALRVISVSAVFHHPVRTGTPVTLELQVDTDGRRIKVIGHAEGRPHVSVRLAFESGIAARIVTAASTAEDAIAPLEPAFPENGAAGVELNGTVPLRVDSGRLAALFPALCVWPEGRSLAVDLMASTRVVGMRCPGLHSIYAEFKLQRRAAPASASALHYRVAKVDPRFRKVRLALEGALLEGTADAFFRASAVAQPSLADIKRFTSTDCTRGQRALVVGGSRGLGEVVAKMLLSGGATVTITYARGHDDAARIVAEAAALGAECSMLALDASTALPSATAEQLAAGSFTHVYYFATPAIAKGGSTWNHALFESFTCIYVDGFAEVVRAASGATPLRIFYPSTVFLDRAEEDFAEYCCAKAAGEALCDHLARDASRFLVQRPRLPRLRTDQNSSFLGLQGSDPVPALAAQLGAFCGWRSAS
jgi:acyl dehydratase